MGKKKRAKRRMEMLGIAVRKLSDVIAWMRLLDYTAYSELTKKVCEGRDLLQKEEKAYASELGLPDNPT